MVIEDGQTDKMSSSATRRPLRGWEGGAGGSSRHNFNDEDRERAHTPEAKERRRRTLAAKLEARVADVVEARLWGMVALAVADHVGISDSYCRRLLFEAQRRGDIEPMPRWTTWTA